MNGIVVHICWMGWRPSSGRDRCRCDDGGITLARTQHGRVAAGSVQWGLCMSQGRDGTRCTGAHPSYVCSRASACACFHGEECRILATNAWTSFRAKRSRKVATKIAASPLVVFSDVGLGRRMPSLGFHRLTPGTLAAGTRPRLRWWPKQGGDCGRSTPSVRRARPNPCGAKPKYHHGTKHLIVVVAVGRPLGSPRGPARPHLVRCEHEVARCVVANNSRRHVTGTEGTRQETPWPRASNVGKMALGRSIDVTRRRDHGCRHALVHRGTRSRPFAADGIRLRLQGTTQDFPTISTMRVICSKTRA